MMRALSIRQPYAEEILRKIKAIIPRTRAKPFSRAPRETRTSNRRARLTIQAARFEVPAGIVDRQTFRCTTRAGRLPTAAVRLQRYLAGGKRNLSGANRAQAILKRAQGIFRFSREIRSIEPFERGLSTAETRMTKPPSISSTNVSSPTSKP